MRIRIRVAVVASLCAPVILLFAQGPPGGRGGGGRGPGGPSFDPVVVARGKTIYDANCASCHAPDMRGSKTGINLDRDQIVLDDKGNGDTIGPFISAPHANGAAAKVDLTSAQLGDLATFMRSTAAGGRGISMPPPANALLRGDAKAGEAYFKATCAGCHSLTDAASSGPSLKGIGTKYADDPKGLQNFFVSGGGGGRGFGGPGGGGGGRGTPTTVKITMPDGKVLEGTLNRSDDFLILMTDKDGNMHNIARNGDLPKVEIHNPKQAHLDLLPKYKDSDIHNLTAYLVTVK